MEKPKRDGTRNPGKEMNGGRLYLQHGAMEAWQSEKREDR